MTRHGSAYPQGHSLQPCLICVAPASLRLRSGQALPAVPRGSCAAGGTPAAQPPGRRRYVTPRGMVGVSNSPTTPRRVRCPRTGLSFKVFASMPTTGERFERAVSIMARLRAPGGCPWDREQTFDSIKPYTLEETYEVLEAIDNRDWDELPGELGDLLLHVLFYAQMAKDDGTFSIDDVLDRLADKLIGRHPHVFGEVKAETSSEVLRNWQSLKAREKEEKDKKN